MNVTDPNHLICISCTISSNKVWTYFKTLLTSWNKHESLFISVFPGESGDAKQRQSYSQQLYGSALALVTIKGHGDIAPLAPFPLLFPLTVASQVELPFVCVCVCVYQKTWERKWGSNLQTFLCMCWVLRWEETVCDDKCVCVCLCVRGKSRTGRWEGSLSCHIWGEMRVHAEVRCFSWVWWTCWMRWEADGEINTVLPSNPLWRCMAVFICMCVYVCPITSKVLTCETSL